MHFNRTTVFQLVVSAILFFLLIRFLSFLGVALVLTILVFALVWYGYRTVTGSTALSSRWEAWRDRKFPTRPADTRPVQPPDATLTHDERATFNEIAQHFHDGGKSDENSSA